MAVDSPRPSRFRWFLRFSLRTLLVLLTIACVAGGWFFNRVQRQRDAVAWVNANGGYVWYAEEMGRNDWGSASGRRSADIDAFDYPVRVELSGKQINDLAPLRRSFT